MLFKIFLFISGILLTSISLMFVIMYLNLINMGYSFFDFFYFIIKRIECLMFFLGIILIVVSMNIKKGIK